MPKAFDAEELERQGTVIGSSRTDHEEYAEISGVWEETWCVRARLAAQAERYRAWLREQGCSRDQAATMAVRLLLASEPDAPAQTTPPNIPVLH
jgi:hypothetical protein